MKKTICSMVALVAMSACADVKMTDAKLAIDGRLDEAAWSTADWEGGFQRFRNAQRGRKPTQPTEFAVLADAENIYVGVKAAHKKMNEVKAKGRVAVWGAEAVEFYFCPDGGTFDFYQFLVSFQGANHAIFYSEGGNIRPDPYGPVWEAKVAETPEGWTCEAKIPLSAFYMTRGSAWKTTWKVNIARSYRDAGSCDFNCWIDGNGYRDLKNFKTIKGFPVRRAAEDVWVKSAVAKVSGPKDGKLAGELDFVVNVAEKGAFTLESGFTQPRTVSFAAGDNKVSVPAVFPPNGRYPMPITLTRTDGTAVCQRTYPVIVDYHPIRLSFTRPAYRTNFYPGQNADRVEGSVVSAVGGPITLTLEGPGFGRKEQTLSASGKFAFDTAGFTEGTATLTVKAGGETLASKVRKLGSLGEGHHVSWVENGNLVVDGKPILRRNMYAEYYNGGEAFKKKYDADNLHLTLLTRPSCGTLEPARLVKGIETKEAIRDVKPSDELFRKIDEVIARAKAGDGVYYYISDEPECRNISPIYLKYIYDYVTDKDPYHVILTCSRAGEKYLKCADWFETHPYISAHYVDGKRVYGRQFNELGDYISAFNPERHPDKCVGGTATCFSYSGGDYPTFTEYIANAWCEFLRGAKTLYPYAYHDLGDRAALYEGTRYLFSSAEALESILLRGKRQTLAKTADYEAALWTMPDGEQMFCVQNFKTEPQTVTVPGLTGTFFEFRGKRTFNLRHSTFNLQPLESLVATTKRHDAGLPTFAETQALVDRLEAERLGRPNQLLGRYLDVEFATSTAGNGARKIFDGTRDVVAWSDNWGKNKFYEMSFPKFVPEFSEMTIYGSNIGGTRVKVRAGGEWKELVPVTTEEGTYSLRYVFDRAYATVKIRLEFPQNKVELYEIELPGKPRVNAASTTDTRVKKN